MALADRSSGQPVGRHEVEAVLATRAELGPEYDAELVESFADRIEQVIEVRVAGRVAESTTSGKQLRAAAKAAGDRQMILGFVSLGTGIPITAISASIAGLPGLIAAWAGIVGVNVAHAVQSRRGS